MADTPWTHQNWDSNPVGSPTRLTELRAHLSEVRLSFQRAASSGYAVQGKSHTWDADSLERYLGRLEKALAEEEVIPGSTTTPVSTTFTRGRALPR